MRIISNEDARRLQEMWEWYSRERGRSRAERSLPLPSIQAPEVYFAKPQSASGIPALANDDEPGSDDCDIYKLDDSTPPALVAVTGLDKTVYNISPSDVPQEWITVARDKFGKWIALLGAGTPIILGKLDAALNQGSSATMSVWTGNPLSDSSDDETVYDWLLSAGDSLAQTSKCVCVKYHGLWYVIAAECPA